MLQEEKSVLESQLVETLNCPPSLREERSDILLGGCPVVEDGTCSQAFEDMGSVVFSRLNGHEVHRTADLSAC